MSWIEARDRKKNKILIGGLGALGVGSLWFEDDGRYKDRTNYETAPEKEFIESPFLRGKHMELNLQVDTQKINEYMAQKIIESSLGAQVKKAIEDKFKEFDGYNSPLKNVVDQHIRNIIQEQLQTTYAPQITEAIKKAIDPEAITKLVQEFVSNLKFEKRY